MTMSAAGHLLRVTALNTGAYAPYAPLLALQELLADQRRAKQIPDTLLQLEHSHVYTVGKRGGPADFRTDAAALAAGGAAVAASPRGGETTYHGPGQLVAYPVVSLRELGVGARAYVEGLEDVLVATLGRFGIAARGRVPGKTGVWVGERKVAAIGVRISGGVASHGIALNVCPDLGRYAHIVPCGTPDKEVTSIHRQLAGAQWGQQQQQLGSLQPSAATAATAAAVAAGGQAWVPPLATPSLPAVAACFLDAFCQHFGYGRLEQLPDVNALAAQMGCLAGGSAART